MIYSITAPSAIRARITLPASKSISNRALVLHAFSGGEAELQNLSDCDDTLVTIKALRDKPEVVDIMAAGTAMRFLTAYYSVTPGTRIITGTERMRHRPIGILVDALRTLGAEIEYMDAEGFPPLRITGKPLKGGEVTLEGSVSSQYISALLMMGGALPQGLTLHLIGKIISRPYIKLTMQLMRDFGAEVAWTSEDTICVKGGGYQDTPYYIESDWSAASYWYEMTALCPEAEVALPGLFAHSYQGDSEGAKLFEKLGVKTDFTSGGVVLTKSSECAERLDANLVEIPDLAQTFVVTCCLKGVPFRFTGLQSLRIKETDRISALITELRKLGFVLKAEGDEVLSWDGERCLPEAHPVITTYEDHRMAMAFAPASFLFDNLQIANPEVVSKSYPHFWEDLKTSGFLLLRIEN
ncbi:MAG: 3-phosphoshikimate 1-carboxyvinyltransferase [Bacteroidaceae bacterium]|nr:3-phosphoshikimate 1-carboxyvinyltransferase [Bacteroidaceae bacterium]